ncbi:hypothetical protein D3C80_1117090 [compost metagenome]
MSRNRQLPGGGDVERRELAKIHGIAVEAHQQVPHGFIAVLRDRERNTRVHPGDRGPASFERGLAGVVDGVVLHPFWRGRSAVRGVHVDAEAWVALDQGNRACGELAGVLLDITLVDRQQRLFSGKRVRPDEAFLVEAGWRSGKATGIGRNATVLVAALLSAHRREALAQLAEVRACEYHAAIQRQQSCNQHFM